MKRLFKHAKNRAELAITIFCMVIVTVVTVVLVGLAVYGAVHPGHATGHPELVPAVPGSCSV